MNPELLKTFLAVSRHLNFTRAAEERLLTQPAVSRQIKQLERRLGVPLFEKLGKSIGLTDAGRAFVSHAADLLGQMDRIAESVRAYRSPSLGRLRIGASTTPGYFILPPILGEFHREYPEVQLNYVVENTLSIEQRIVRNELDIAFVGGHPVNTSLRIEPVLDDNIVCFCGQSHPLSRRRRVSAAALSDELWVLRERGSATRQLFEKRWAALDGEIRRTLELPSPEGIKALVGAGIGVSFISVCALQDETSQRRLHKLAIDGLRLSRPIYAVRHPAKYESPVMNAFLDRIRKGSAPADRPRHTAEFLPCRRHSRRRTTKESSGTR